METAKVAVAVDVDVHASSASSSSSAVAVDTTHNYIAAATVADAPSKTTTAMTEAKTKTTTTTTTTTTKKKEKKASSVVGVGVGGNIEQQRAKSTYRYVEDVNSGLRLDMELRGIHHNSISDVQSIQVIETCFGKTLVTDGKTQSSAHDECVYHESLVHPAMFWCAHRNGHRRATNDDDAMTGWPKSVFIGGGGELATAREVLRHSSTVKRVVMVDIDPDVVDVCRAYLPEWGGDAVLNHPTLEYVVGDARAYLRDAKIKFDVIIMDVTDPIEYGPAEALYNVEFYDMVKDRLDVGGVFVTQAGSASFVPLGTSSTIVGTNDDGDEDGSDYCVDDGSCLAPIRNTLARVFDNALPYTAPVPSFGEDWGYVIAYDDVDVDTLLSSSNTTNGKITQVSDMAREYIDDMIEERIGTVPGVPDHESVIRGRDRRDGRSRRRNINNNNNNNNATTTERDGTTATTTTTTTTTTTIASNHASSMEGGGGSGSDGRRGGRDVLRHYDGIAHSRLFALSKQLRESIMDDDRVMTEANPIYMY